MARQRVLAVKSKWIIFYFVSNNNMISYHR